MKSLYTLLVSLLVVLQLQSATVRISGTRLDFIADPGEANNLSISLVAGSFIIHDSGAPVLPNPGDGFTVVSANEVSISATGFTQIQVTLGDLDDSVQIASDITTIARLFGDDGDDILLGGGGDDHLFTSPGNNLLDGGPGFDRIFATADTDMALSDLDIAVVGQGVDTFVNVEQIDLVGGAGANNLDASAVTASSGFVVRLLGEGGDDILIGGAGSDHFLPGQGSDFLVGGGSSDYLFGQADADMFLNNTSLTITGEGTDTFSGFEIIVLEGGPGNNLIDASSVSGTSGFIVRMYGYDGDDTLAGGGANDDANGGAGRDTYATTRDADIILTDDSVAIGSELDRFVEMEVVNLGGGANPNRLDASAVTTVSLLVFLEGFGGDDILIGGGADDVFGGGAGSDSITGGSGYDVLSVSHAGLTIITDTTVQAGVDLDTFSGIEFVNIHGGPGNDTFDASQTTGQFVLQIEAKDGDDTLIGGIGSLANMLTLSGAAGNDTYVLQDAWGYNSIGETSGNDTLDLSLITSPLQVTLDGAQILWVVSGANYLNVDLPPIENIIGGSGVDLLSGTDVAATWNISGSNTGSVLGIAFTGFENLRGGNQSDTFVFADGAGVTGSIDAGAGSDTIDWSGFGTPPVISISGPGSLDGSQGVAANLGGGFDNVEHLVGQSAVSSIVVFGELGVFLKQGVTVVSGDIVANMASSGPYLSDGSEMIIGQSVEFLSPTSRVFGDTVKIKQGAVVYDVHFNELDNNGQILGQLITPLSLPVVPQLPLVPAFTPGIQDIDLPQHGTITLGAGDYGDLIAKHDAVVTLTGGIYNFDEFDIRQDAQVRCLAPVEIRVSSRVNTDKGSVLGPDPSATALTAADIRMYVNGVNGSNGNVSASAKSVKFGDDSTVRANVYAPNGTIWIREGSSATGAFLGKWVVVGENTVLTLEGGL